MENGIPPARRICTILRNMSPDVVLVTPLVDFGSRQLDYLKAAKHLGIRNCLCVASWDNLTNKGIIQLEPDCVIVWNEDQKKEAIELHGIPPSKVVITGAQSFDKWFEARPSIDRIAFCQFHGFDPQAPTILYVCSSAFIAEREADFVLRWLTHIRGSGHDIVRKANILIRPHPLNAGQWADVDTSSWERVDIYPRSGAYVTTDNAKTDYYDCIYHSDAVVGINTSALIEAGVIGRVSHTILAQEFAETQEGTLHFDYLVRDGYLRVARDFKEHAEQLAQTLQTGAEAAARLREFVGRFVRPLGMDRPCTPIVADAVEALSSQPGTGRAREGVLLWLGRAMLFPVAVSFFAAFLAYRAARRIALFVGMLRGQKRSDTRLRDKLARLPAGSPLEKKISRGSANVTCKP
jgi:hypothetical protein